ncbi:MULTISPECIES: GNAT family N-acetyltransferase [Vibrio]|jgi:ribosomal protein S18 acetylase RimI-like enzyme|uniref:N-acetyltransferase n=1 Tax=Vibrio diazotrophicus TaxID=685 RepID=A0ABX4WBG4_VIBDI|nr:GNAT family N-acetyltransferase [Vibrio diazotrophicus]MCZ4370167.1 GNAT family N-acetyltransferase [Vibrio diazotrophicus]PNH78606.1 N-acetyltransferase [Vibrio diazotrophicus]PNH91223.1 N-acetyltransferase [Vibrio diazotrophicus]PNH99081.1 N-acetyltransferase [Vibrio diazotrophicus]PNI00369.1 N-acetyltransferase [Vibrio diazotrophicus]
MEIRIAEYSDYEKIAALHVRSWKTHYQGLLKQDYLDNEALPDRLVIWQTRLTNPPFNQHILLLEEKDQLVGFICAFGNHDFERGSIIESLHIDPEYQGRGLGKKLIREMAKWIDHYFPDNGVYLEVLEQNRQAIDFYDHIGGEHQLQKLWKAPCGTEVPEFVYAWKTPKLMLASIE